MGPVNLGTVQSHNGRHHVAEPCHDRIVCLEVNSVNRLYMNYSVSLSACRTSGNARTEDSGLLAKCPFRDEMR
jgi:hypothetical protein